MDGIQWVVESYNYSYSSGAKPMDTNHMLNSIQLNTRWETTGVKYNPSTGTTANDMFSSKRSFQTDLMTDLWIIYRVLHNLTNCIQVVVYLEGYLWIPSAIEGFHNLLRLLHNLLKLITDTTTTTFILQPHLTIPIVIWIYKHFPKIPKIHAWANHDLFQWLSQLIVQHWRKITW